MSLSSSSPLSLYSIPIVWFLGFYPNVLKGRLLVKTIGFNNVQPRDNVARLERHKDAEKVSAEIAAKARRLEAAHLNGTETFPLWGIAVLAGNYARMDNETLNKLALSYAVLRIAFNYIYANQTTRFQALLRSAVWTAATSIPLYILVKAANIVRLGL
ncbi:putative MAPEG family protein [Lyophyllum shimeji]|uniref:MAPEG family protein n=1 Tax=Lyophyllum shimeji TaxID=47721 RepID=A0A9P3US94_LYOSH|nr:putative MAPEG family protein [Lyophyllum shimeji]